jgi:hypothetical protein
MLIDPVGNKSFQIADRHWTIEFSSIAFLFTGMVANSPYRSRKRIVLFDHIEGLLISARLNQGDVALGACLRRARVFAWTRSSFGYKKGVWNRLRIRPVNGLPLVQSLVEFVRKKNGADLCAVIAAGTFLHIDVTGVLSNRCLEMSSFAF